MIPTLTTERLILRAPVMADFEPYAAVMMSERARYLHGPFTYEGAYRDFCTDVAGWHLKGFGPWSIERRDTGAYCGIVILHQPPEFPEREMGWVLVPQAEGHGFAREAALAARAHAFGALGWDTLVSYIAPGNTRSIALAERLGAVRDHDAPAPDGCGLVYRHSAPSRAAHHST